SNFGFNVFHYGQSLTVSAFSSRECFYSVFFFGFNAATSRLHSARVSISICYTQPCGWGLAGVFRLFQRALGAK
ncbi:MAG: hypothetical protein KAR64_00760, partial [Thermoplasmatales archaeon]|nr:hypothetical protein [Thermoplasmatales archaeon]